MITAADELRHPAGPGLQWSESYYFSFFDPSSDVGGFFRIGLEENKQQANLWCNLMRGGKAIYNRFRLNLPYSAAGLEDVTVGSLRLRMVEALKIINISFGDRGLTFDLTWEGFHEVFDMREAMGEMSASVASGHYEQSGVIAGHIRINEETIVIRGYSFRDHSWGVRDWEGVKLWKTCMGQFGTEFAFAAGEITETSGKKSCLGLIYDGHKTMPIAKATVDLDDDIRPTQGLVTLEDRDGKLTKIDVEFQLVCDMPYDLNMIHECYTRQRKGDRVGYGIVEINRRLC